ncbi:hypothetical protein GWI33_009730, partial [Rhynchophorus ferrugineus]
QEAREIIRNAVNASEDDAVIFCGHGCTDALNKLIWALDIREPPVVFTGHSEHHDNLNLWQKTGAKCFQSGYFDSISKQRKRMLLKQEDIEVETLVNQN